MVSSLPRLRDLTLSARAFRWVATANVVWLFVIVANGASVRLTGSGLGCLHWPGCYAGTRVFPATYHGDIEFANRLVSAVAVAATLGTWLLSCITPTLPSWARKVAAFAFLGTLAEAPLGAVTVEYKLNPWLVGSHFLLSLVVLGLSVLVLIEAFDARGDAVPDWVRRGALVVVVACATLVVTGTAATAAGPHSGSVDVPRVWSFYPAVWLHVRAAAAFGISFAFLLAWLAWRRRSQARLAFVVLGVLAAQMAVGEIQYRTMLPWWLVLVHVTLAACLWAATAALVALLWRPVGAGGERAGAA